MGLWNRLTGWMRPQANAPAPSSDFWYQSVGADTASGVAVTPDSALQVSAVYACVRVRAETLASLPLLVYERLTNGGKERASRHPLYRILHDQPNRWQTSFEWRMMMQAHLDLRGNAYSEIIPGELGAVTELVPLHPDRVTPYRKDNGRIGYEVKSLDATKAPRQLTQDQVFHLRGLSSDGIVGLSPIALHREAIGLSMSQEKYGSKLFGNFARPGGILTHPAKLSDEARKNLRASWQSMYAGPENAYRTAILEEGMTWAQVGMTNEDAQFLESRNYQVRDICRIFRVPSYKVQDMQPGTVSFASVEQQAIDFITDTIRPACVNWEQRILADLVVDDETFFAEFLFDALLRGDAASRTQALVTQFMNGALTIDEWRSIENRNPLPDGKGTKHYVPLNIAPVEQLDNLSVNPDPPGPRQAPGTKPAPEEDAATLPPPAPAAEWFRPLVVDAAERIARAELRELEKRAGKAAEDRERFDKWADGFYGQHALYVSKTLWPLAVAWANDAGMPRTPDVDAFAAEYAGRAVAALKLCDPVKVLEKWQLDLSAITADQIEEFFRCSSTKKAA